MKLLEVLRQNFTLMVSLPRNDLELAQAAVDAGAQCIKVHLNCHHYASDTTFGSLDQERPVLKKILAAVDIPGGYRYRRDQPTNARGAQADRRDGL